MADISPHASEILPPCTRSSRVVRRDKDLCAATARSSFPGTLLRSMKTLDKRCREYSSRCWQSSMIINHCCSAWTRANNHVQRQYIGCCVSISYNLAAHLTLHCIATVSERTHWTSCCGRLARVSTELPEPWITRATPFSACVCLRPSCIRSCQRHCECK